MRSLIVITSIFLATLLMACKGNSVSPETAATSPLAISPQDNESNVGISSGVTLAFTQKVDPSAVERGLHLISSTALIDSLCPVSRTMQHGSMSSVMNDTMLMSHLESVHSLSGKFYWSSDSLYCTFRPDSALMTNTRYMIHMDRAMVQMMSSRLGNMGTMGRQEMNGMEDMMFHFTTAGTTSTGGGHNGHH